MKTLLLTYVISFCCLISSVDASHDSRWSEVAARGRGRGRGGAHASAAHSVAGESIRTPGARGGSSHVLYASRYDYYTPKGSESKMEEALSHKDGKELDTEIAKYIDNVNVNFAGRFSEAFSSPLIRSLDYKNLKLLLDKGLDPNHPAFWHEFRPQGKPPYPNNTPLMVMGSWSRNLRGYCRFRKEYDIARKEVFVPFEEDMVPLRHRVKDIVELFITYGADVNAADHEGNTVLHWFALGGCPEAIDLLIAHGADVNARNKNKKTPRDLATNSDVQKILESRGMHSEKKRPRI
jgi:hypothetical protein